MAILCWFPSIARKLASGLVSSLSSLKSDHLNSVTVIQHIPPDCCRDRYQDRRPGVGLFYGGLSGPAGVSRRCPACVASPDSPSTRLAGEAVPGRNTGRQPKSAASDTGVRGRLQKKAPDPTAR